MQFHKTHKFIWTIRWIWMSIFSIISKSFNHQCSFAQKVFAHFCTIFFYWKWLASKRVDAQRKSEREGRARGREQISLWLSLWVWENHTKEKLFRVGILPFESTIKSEVLIYECTLGFHERRNANGSECRVKPWNSCRCFRCFRTFFGPIYTLVTIWLYVCGCVFESVISWQNGRRPSNGIMPFVPQLFTMKL